jgi:hypothetical protein
MQATPREASAVIDWSAMLRLSQHPHHVGSSLVWLTGLICGAALVMPGVSGASKVAALHGQTPVRAWNGVQAWTDYDSADKRWHVVVRSAGTIATPTAIPAGGERLQVDVGPGPDGRPTLAYVSCAEVCRVVISGLDGLGAHTVSGTTHASAVTIWGSRVAWVRGRNTVLTRRLQGGKATRLGGVPRHKCYRSFDKHYCERPSSASVAALELGNSQLALIDTYGLTHGGANGEAEVRMQSVRGGPQRLVALMNLGEGNQSWNGPAWAGGDLFFYRSCPFGCPGSEGPYRYDPDSGAYAKAPSAGAVAGFAMDDVGRRAFEALGGASSIGDRHDSAGYLTSLRLTGLLEFTATRAPIASPDG